MGSVIMENQNNSANLTENVSIGDDKNLADLAQYIKDGQHGHKKSIPPVQQWTPKHCGSMDLCIKANGEWWHEGQLIKRQALIDTFARVLWKENEHFYLKTPVEQIQIQVEDEPFFVNQVHQVVIQNKTYLQLTTTTDDVIIVDAEHSIFMRDYQGERRPYVHVRFGMNALIQRASFLHLIEFGELVETSEDEVVLRLQSGDLHLQLQS